MMIGNRFGGYNGPTQPKTDFNELFSRDNLQAEDILKTKDIVDEVRMTTDVFSRQLMKRPDIITDLIDYAVRPQLQQQRKGEFPIMFPFVSIEILCAQNEQFLDFMLGKRRAIEDSKQTEQQKLTEPLLLQHFFLCLDMPNRVNETAVGYLQRYLSQMQYQKGNELFQFITSRPNIMQLMYRHAYSKSIVQVLTKLLTVQNEQYNEKKMAIFENLYIELRKETVEVQVIERLECLAFLYENIIQRASDRYDGPRFVQLLSSTFNSKNTESLVDVMEKNFDKEDILEAGFDIIIQIGSFNITEKSKNGSQEEGNKQSLHFNIDEEAMHKILKLIEWLLKKLEQSQQIPQEIEAHKKSEDEMLLDDSNTKVDEDSVVTQQAKEQFPDKLENESHKSQSLLLQSHVTTAASRTKIKPSLIRLIESAQKFNHLLRLVNKDNNFAEKIIDTKFLKFIVNLFKKHPMNNFLHNAISQLLIDVINNDKVTETICSKESGLIQFIIQQSESEEGFVVQLHHIAQAIIILKDPKLKELIKSQHNQWEKYINGAYTQRTTRYNRLLGGQDPKKKSFEFCRQKKTQNEERPQSSRQAERGELGDDQDQIPESIGLDIDSDDEKKKKQVYQGNEALRALMTKDEVRSEDDETVRVDEDLPIIKMEIGDPLSFSSPSKEEETIRIPEEIPLAVQGSYDKVSNGSPSHDITNSPGASEQPQHQIPMPSLSAQTKQPNTDI